MSVSLQQVLHKGKEKNNDPPVTVPYLKNFTVKDGDTDIIHDDMVVSIKDNPGVGDEVQVRDSSSAKSPTQRQKHVVMFDDEY